MSAPAPNEIASPCSSADEGPGVPADSIARLFEPFYRVDVARTRESGGTGLGPRHREDLHRQLQRQRHRSQSRSMGGLEIEVELETA